jgi:hypothetical protein
LNQPILAEFTLGSLAEKSFGVKVFFIDLPLVKKCLGLSHEF